MESFASKTPTNARGGGGQPCADDRYECDSCGIANADLRYVLALEMRCEVAARGLTSQNIPAEHPKPRNTP